MTTHETIITQTTNLVNQYKLIHSPGSIQPHGVLLAINEVSLLILQVSNNTEEFLDKTADELLNQPLNTIVGDRSCQEILQCLSEGAVNSLKLTIETKTGERYFDATVHGVEKIIILELEISSNKTEITFLQGNSLLRGIIANMQNTSNMTDFLQLLASEVRKITGFDRVMVYKFDQHQAGSVVAEDKLPDLIPYLGLHYPSTDIPQASRELYKRNLIRYIPNLTTKVIELVPETHQPLDLSCAILRSSDECCVKFHQNMGVNALLVISLIHEQKLWGFISCHHQTPKYLPYEIRTFCELLGQIASLELGNKAIQEDLDSKAKLKSLQSDFIKSISQASNFIEVLTQPEAKLLDFVNSPGAALCLGSEINQVGNTPSDEQINALIEWANIHIKDEIFSTHCLTKHYPEAEEFKDTASGLLLLRISLVKRYYILWFRPEVIQTVNWAGNPRDSIQIDADGNIALSPRTSFALWQEIVRLTSISWKQWEIDSALDLRNAIVGIVINKADELARINLELERSNKELDSFAYAASHDLKEPLRGIHNYSIILLEDYGYLLDEEGIEFLNTLLSLTQRMDTLIDVLLKLSQLGQTELRLQTTNLNELVSQVVNMFRASRQKNNFDIRIAQALPIVECDSVLISEVFSNLIGNALKYNDSPEKSIEVGYLPRDDDSHHPNHHFFHDSEGQIFYIKDNGIGIKNHHRETIFRLFKRLHSQEKYGGGTGAGLAITKKIIERHGGHIWVESNYGQGSTFYFTL
jgi:two-component system, chemotaxis family, sensor kinase Cph1